MRITRLRLANWRSFKNVDIALADRVLVFGPNASGKSNLLDAVRFLRDLTIPTGGLQYAVSRREGVSRLRFLNTRNNNRRRVMVAVAVGDGEDPAQWEYEIHFAREKSGVRPVVISEIVRHFGTEVYDNTAAADSDPELATQTALEQVSVNRDFRDLVEFFAGVEYLHLVPQIVRDATRGGIDAHDPYGGSLLLEVGTAPKKDYERRRRVMQEALRLAVPQFESLERFQDPAGSWHLRAQYRSAGALVERLLGASLVSETLLVRTRCEPSSHGCLLTTTESGSTSPLRRWSPTRRRRSVRSASSSLRVGAHGLGGFATRWCRGMVRERRSAPATRTACTSSHGTAGIQSQQR